MQIMSISSVLLFVAALSFIAVSSNGVSNINAIKASNNEPYSLNLSDLNETHESLISRDENTIYFDVSGFNGSRFDVLGTIKNESLIGGLQSISIDFVDTGKNLTISYGWGNNDYIVTDGVMNSSSSTYNFNEEYPSYFMVENKSGNDINVNSVTLTYTCSPTTMPESYKLILEFYPSKNYYYVAGVKDGVTSVSVPSTYLGSPVGLIYTLGGSQTIESVTLPDSIVEISANAFQGCINLSSINIPSSVKTIGQAAFSGLPSLTSITVPSSVTSLGQSIFQNCTSLETVIYNANNSTLNLHMFEGCTSLTSVLLSSKVQTIGSYAFSGCSSLASINLPTSVTAIRADAFSNCTSLTTINYSGTLYQWNYNVIKNDGWISDNDHDIVVVCTDGEINYPYE